MINVKDDELMLKIRAFFSKNFNDSTSLGDEENIFELGLVDSLFAMKIVLFVEEAFGFDCNDEDLNVKNFCSIKNIHNFVEKKLQAIV